MRTREPMLMQDLANALSRAARCINRQLEQAMQSENCTLERWRVLSLLADGRGHQMSEIAEFALLPAPSVTRLVDRMVTDGLAHRTIDPQDLRRVLVLLTPRGRSLHRKLAARIQAAQLQLTDDDDPADVRTLLVLLAELVDRVGR